MYYVLLQRTTVFYSAIYVSSAKPVLRACSWNERIDWLTDSALCAIFYRASACPCEQSAILLYLFCLSVDLFVFLSNAGTVSKRMGISSHFRLSGRGSTLVISALPPLQNTKETPQRGVKYKGVGQFCKYRHLSRKQYEIGLKLLCNKKSQVADREVSVSVTLSHLGRRAVRSQNRPSNLHNYVRVVWHRMTEFGVFT